jgi:YhcH/YjgK/YiaL family protein
MILDHIQNIDNYRFLGSPVIRALEVIRDTDFSKLEDTTYEVEGRDLFFFIQSYETKADNDTPEAHRKYIDIQYMISGKEQMGVAQLDAAEEIEARPENDIWFYHSPMDYITLSPGMFAVFFPNDAHAPCISPAGETYTVRKCVFKVRV